MRKIIVLLVTFTFPQFVMAAMFNYFGFTGIVKGFDKETVTVSVQGKSFKVARSQILTGSIKSGEAVYFQLSGEELQKHFARTPAAAGK